jgi:NADH-quinone oxidoreductase subunit I
MNIKEYFVSIFKGFHSLIKGMEVTGVELVTPKVTEQYPENRAELKIPERFRATLEFIYDDNGYHKCIACGSCERNCPNQTISITKRMVELPDGKKKQKLDKYMYDLGSCTFCGLCVQVCPTNAIRFSNDFEQAVFTREKLVKQLNYLPEKDDAPAPKPVAKPAAPAAPAAPKPAAPAADKPAAPAADESKQEPKENKE